MWLYNSHSNLFMGFTFFQLAYGVESTLPIEYKIMNFHMTKYHLLELKESQHKKIKNLKTCQIQ
jgi:hypothetical protein